MLLTLHFCFPVAHARDGRDVRKLISWLICGIYLGILYLDLTNKVHVGIYCLQKKG